VKSSAGSAEVRLTTGAIGTTWKWRPEQLLEGELSVSMNLDKVTPLFLSKDHLTEGNLTADISVLGTLDAPEMTGLARLQNGYYEYSPTATTLGDIHAEIEASGSRLQLRKLTATDGREGTLSAAGWLDLASARDFPFSIDLTLKDATLARSDYLTGTLGGTLTASGSAADAILSGELSSGPVDVHLPERIALDAKELEVIEINIPEDRAERIEPRRATPTLDLALDLGIALPRRVFVRGGGLDSEWSGALHIEGTAAAPIVTGTLEIVRGHIDFAGRRFRLTGGKVAFGREVPPVPRLDIAAESDVGDITAVLRLSGPISSPTLAISSDPPMPSNEVLARVLFGESVAKITPLQALRLAHVVNTLARGGDGFAVIARTRKIMNLDRLSLEQSDDSLEGTAITAGKYLTGDIYVEIKKGISDKDAGISFEKKLLPGISIKGEFDTTGGKGLRIKWKRDY
jgi:translocation and assembly module TamB